MKPLHIFALLLLAAIPPACGDAGSPAGKGGQGAVDCSGYVWNENSLHFAKLRDAVRTCDYAEGGFSDLRFDADGMLTQYRFTGYDAGGNQMCTRDRTSRVPAKKEEIPGDRSPARDFLSNRTNPTNL